MFNDINKVQLLGNVTSDPDLRFTPGGSAVLNFGLATNRRYKKDEQWTDDTTFHNIVIWGSLAQSLSTRIKKGTRLFLGGRLQVRTWDGNDGKKQYKTEIVADEVSLVSRYNEGTNAELAAAAPMPAATKSAAPQEEYSQPAASAAGDEPDFDIESSIDPDDLPF